MSNELPAGHKSPAERASEQGLNKLSEEERKLHALLVPAYHKSAIPLSKFEGLYDSNMIAMDTAYVEEREQAFERRDNPELAFFTRRAELFEALVREEIKTANWLGSEAKPVTASRYDDIKNGVDLIVEFLKKEGTNRLALSVDVTSNITSLEDKLQKIKGQIIKGKLTEVKYFIGSDGNRQEIQNVPRVVIGTESRVIQELSELRLEIHTCVQALKHSSSAELSEETTKWYRARGISATEKLESHRVQTLILDEMRLQLEAFIIFARKNGQETIVAEYEKALRIIRELRESKRNLPEQTDMNNLDSVYGALKVGLKIFEE